MSGWSKISNSELGRKAIALYRENRINHGLEYHTWFHITMMYDFLEEYGVPYSNLLDYAILFHDIVYDKEPHKEVRSVQKFRQMVGDELTSEEKHLVAALIMATEKHEIDNSGWDDRIWIILADLHGFAKPNIAFDNYIKVREECFNLYNCSPEEFGKGNFEFLRDLYARLSEAKENVRSEHLALYSDIQEGVYFTLSISNTLQNSYYE